MRGPSSCWHYHNALSPPGLHLSSSLLTCWGRMEVGGTLLVWPDSRATGNSCQVYSGRPQQKASGTDRGFVCLRFDRLPAVQWGTERTGPLWVVNKGFELDVIPLTSASDVQPAIHGRDPCVPSHRRWCCISAGHSSSHLEACQSNELKLRLWFHFSFFFDIPPCCHTKKKIIINKDPARSLRLSF